MKDEIEAAAEFITRLVKGLTDEKLTAFRRKLTEILTKRFENHWYKEEPTKGQAYRCIRINEFEPVDGVLDQAARDSGLTFRQLCLPQELTVWVDPAEVCCRFGEDKGSFCTVANFRGQTKENNASTLDIAQLLQRHRDLKRIEMKRILYSHNRQCLQTFNNNNNTNRRPSFSPVASSTKDFDNVNMSNWSNASSNSWKAKSLNGHVTSKKAKFSWLAAEMIVA